MILDHLSKETDGKQIIEVLVGEDGAKVWIPAMATDLRILGNDRELRHIKEIRVRNLEEENA